MSATEPPTPPAESIPPLVPIRSEGFLGGGRLLAADVRVLYLFADEARRRALKRFFGISRVNKSGLETLIVLAVLAGAAQRRAQAVPKPSRPSPIGVTTGVALVAEGLYGIAGPWAREAPNVGTLLALAVVASSARFVVRKSIGGVKAASHEARREFDHRYGHLIRPNRRRRQVMT